MRSRPLNPVGTARVVAPLGKRGHGFAPVLIRIDIVWAGPCQLLFPCLDRLRSRKALERVDTLLGERRVVGITLRTLAHITLRAWLGVHVRVAHLVRSPARYLLRSWAIVARLV